MSFKTKKYQVIRNALDKTLANFIFNYMMLQRDAVDFMRSRNKVNPFNPLVGTRSDHQVPGAYSKYADWVMETLLMYMIPIMKAKTGMELVPTYSYTRLYEKGNILERHKDRDSCEISTTMHLGGNEWPIFMDGTGSDNILQGKDSLKSFATNKLLPEFTRDPIVIRDGAPKGTKITLKVGDMLIYSGCELEHWREPFEGNVCSQAFLHYNHANGPFAKTNLFDKRPMLGLPK